MRAHFFRPLLDNQGNRVAQASVRILQPATTTAISDTIFADGTTGATLANPFMTGGLDVSIFLTTPQRVRIGITVPGSPERFWEDVDVLASGLESSHLGADVESTQVGPGAAAGAAQATALGPSAAASAPASTAVGGGAAASDQSGVAVGSNSAASAPFTTAVGGGAVGSASMATALGGNARAAFNQSTAVGAGAVTSKANQVVLGTSADDVDVQGTLALTSPDLARWGVKVSAEGILMTGSLADGTSLSPGEEDDGGPPVYPVATTSTRGMVQLDGVASDVQPLGTQAAGASGKAADGLHVHPMPRMQDILSPTVDIAWGGKRITGQANGSAAGHSATVDQLGGGQMSPGMFGLLGWTSSPGDCVSKFAVSAGVMVMVLSRPVVDGTVGKLGVYIGQAGASPTGACVLALFSEAGSLLAWTGDASTAFGTLGFQELSVITPVAVSASSNYYLAMLSNMSTAPQVWSPPLAGGSQIPAIRGHRASITATGLSVLPSTVDVVGAFGNNAVYCLTMGA